MNINLLFEIILVLLAILAINGIIYSLTNFNFNNQNSSENISVITNRSKKDGLALTSLIASNPLRLTSSESSASETLNVTSLESSASQTLSVTSLETSTSQTLSVTSLETSTSQTLSVTSSDLLENENWMEWEINEALMANNQNSNLLGTNEEIIPFDLDMSFDLEFPESYSALDSITILNSQTFAEWREIAMDLLHYPINSPAGVLQQVKFEELNILYSQDLIAFGITQTELRLIIEYFPATSLFSADINHLILTIMSYYHL